jgi:hypothetical protein
MVRFKNRFWVNSEPVSVYRNLNKKGKWYSIKQKGLVVAHTENIHMYDCKFIVNK